MRVKTMPGLQRVSAAELGGHLVEADLHPAHGLPEPTDSSDHILRQLLHGLGEFLAARSHCI